MQYTNNSYTNVWIGTNAETIDFQNVNNIFIGQINKNNSSIIRGANNIFAGKRNNSFNYSGNYNVFIGDDAGGNGDYNITLGFQSGKTLYNGSYNNILLGKQAGLKVLTGSNNIFIGNQTGYTTEKGSNNIFIGNQAGYYERNSNRLYISNSNTTSPLIFGDFINNYIKINSVIVLQETATPFETAGAFTWDGTNFKGYDGSNWIIFDNYPVPDHNDLPGLQGGSVLSDLFYHSDQPINITDNVEFNTITLSGIEGGTPQEGMIQWNGQNFQGYEGGVWVDLDSQGILLHESFPDLMGGDATHHYHSDQEINSDSDVTFASAVLVNLSVGNIPVAGTDSQLIDSVISQLGGDIIIGGDVSADNLSGTNTGDQNSHEALDDLEGGDGSHHYHSRSSQDLQ